MPEAHHDASSEDDRVAYLEEMVRRQQEQLLLAFSTLGEIGFDLSDFLDAAA
jgi:hypothetical protein